MSPPIDTRCVRCSDLGRITRGIATPAVVVPIRNWPEPAYLQYKGPLCAAHIATFTMATYDDFFHGWYEMMCDNLRARRKPAANPYPNDPSFNWEAFIINPNWEPAPKSECLLQFWRVETLAAKGASYTMGSRR